ncbi:MAG: hypothetical protein KAR20_01085, partial [Candidatus Heimdallarchaeota archaeon]|nr:hypothetical protein [Candidatus Heimdallarchaeota archaeon]
RFLRFAQNDKLCSILLDSRFHGNDNEVTIGINLAIVSVLQASAREIRYTNTLICYEIDLASKYGRTAIIQLLVLCYFPATHHLACQG